jgi:DNA-binding transcriptional ArsR family regulator
MSSEVIETAPFQLSDAPSEPELVAKYFRGLGDPTRLRALELLEEHGELPAGELVQRLGLPQATVSTHLGCLRWCGFVATRREHRSVLYRIADERVRAMVALARELLHDNAEHVAACCTIDAEPT